MNIVVTGAGNGIGYELVLALSRDPGHRIIALSRNKTHLEKLLAATQSVGNNNVHIHAADISKITGEEVDSFAAPLGHLDIVVHNAGLLVNKQFSDLTLADWRSIFEVNVFGVVELTRLLLPYLKKSGAAHIVNIGGMGGLQGTSKFPGLSAYSASKAALANLTECLAEELKEFNIRVNCLALGSVNTEMFKTAFPQYTAPVNAGEMARFVSYFCLNASQFMNGKIVPVSINTP